jgi:protein-S-isoprenylcysteine O-methyltransferase Ste14
MSLGESDFTFRTTAVFLTALIYWGGVVINVYRVRRQIGSSPNLMKYRNLKERLLFLGWTFIILGWIVQPLIIEGHRSNAFFAVPGLLLHPGGAVMGILFALGGYAGTLRCYTELGNSWRLGVNRKARTVLVREGIYGQVRHPIYLFQIIILMGMTCLIPSLFSFSILVVHYLCIGVMARDEEAYLTEVHGSEYEEYLLRTGRFFPGFRSRSARSS